PTRLPSFPTRRSSDLLDVDFAAPGFERSVCHEFPVWRKVPTRRTPQVKVGLAISADRKHPQIAIWCGGSTFEQDELPIARPVGRDRKSTRLNSSHVSI